MMQSYLVVRAGSRRIGLVLESLVAVVPLEPTEAVPARNPAVRGVWTHRGQLLPVVHLGALLEGFAAPAERADAGVVVEAGGCRICLEVDAAEDVQRAEALPVPVGSGLPFAQALAAGEGGTVPLLDLQALGDRLTGGRQ